MIIIIIIIIYFLVCFKYVSFYGSLIIKLSFILLICIFAHIRHFKMADHELDSLEKRLDFIESLVFGNFEKDAFYPRVSIFMPKYPLAF